MSHRPVPFSRVGHDTHMDTHSYTPTHFSDVIKVALSVPEIFQAVTPDKHSPPGYASLTPAGLVLTDLIQYVNKRQGNYRAGQLLSERAAENHTRSQPRFEPANYRDPVDILTL